MKHQAITFILSLAAVLAAASPALQAQSLDPFNPYSSIAPSAETFEMVRYGGLTPSLYTGAMSYSVPVFTYDANGNMTSDGRKGLELRWNVLNLVDSAAMHGSSLKYAWLSDGTKVSAATAGSPGTISAT